MKRPEKTDSANCFCDVYVAEVMDAYLEELLKGYVERDEVEIDEDEVADALICIDFLCDHCEGSGMLGTASNGKKISCENCGGHEDSLGRGYNLEEVAKALSNSDIIKKG